MIIDTAYDFSNKSLNVSFVNKKGNIEIISYPWSKPMEWVSCEHEDNEAHPTYKTWDGKSIKQVPSSYPSRYAMYDFLDTKINKEEREEIFGYNEPNIYFVDIETEATEDGYSEPRNADNRILTISIVYDDKIVLYGLKDLSKEQLNKIKTNTNKYFEKIKIAPYKIKYVKFDSEFDMLHEFFYKAVPKMELITGWNFTNYDWQYLVNRARKVKKTLENGKIQHINPTVSSPSKKLVKKQGTETEYPQHRMIFDYMQLFKILDTSIKVKESNKLDYVAEKLVGIPKIKYNGTLQDLYDDDFETFMLYNAVDSALVQRIHLARNYISIIYAISTLANVKITDCISYMNDNLGTLAITEGILRKRFRDDNIIIFRDEANRVSVDSAEKISGGYVKDPITGMNRWVAVYDFASLYPTTQLQWFIAPENYVGTISQNYITFANMNCTIVGSNYEALDTAFMMACIGKKVNLVVEDSDEFEQYKTDEIYQRVINRGVQISYGKVETVGGDFKVTDITLDDDTNINTDAVFFMYDVDRKTDLFKTLIYVDKDKRKPKFGVKMLPNGFVTDKGIKVNTTEYVVAINGNVFIKKLSPTLRMLSEVYTDRRKNKKLMQKALEKIVELKKRKEELETILLAM